MKEVKFNEITELKPQHTAYIPLVEGIHKLLVEVCKGKIRLNHGAFIPDGGTWLDFPSGRKAHYDFQTGDNFCITVDIQSSFGKTDRLSIVNVSLFQKAEFFIRLCEK